jgi:hypothetical protein
MKKIVLTPFHSKNDNFQDVSLGPSRLTEDRQNGLETLDEVEVPAANMRPESFCRNERAYFSNVPLPGANIIKCSSPQFTNVLNELGFFGKYES